MNNSGIGFADCSENALFQTRSRRAHHNYSIFTPFSGFISNQRLAEFIWQAIIFAVWQAIIFAVSLAKSISL